MKINKYTYHEVNDLSLFPRFEVWEHVKTPSRLIAECSSSDSALAVINLFKSQLKSNFYSDD